jgi:anaerobic selenocysteine-containing dehydrogenase
MERAQFLVFALAGQFGKKGSGINGFPNMWLSGHEGLIAGSGSLPPKYGLLARMLPVIPDILKMRWKGYTQQMMLYEMTRWSFAAGGQVNSNLFQYTHGGSGEQLGSAKQWDPELPREFKDYLKDAVDKGWQFPPKQAPRMFFEMGGNYLRRNRAYTKMMKELWPKLDMVVVLDWRLNFTAMHSDYVFPVSGWYEQDTVPWTTPITPFTQVTTRAVEPLGESRSDWEFQCLFFKALQERAIERGVLSYKDRGGESRKLDEVYEEFTFKRRFTEDNEEELWKEAINLADNVGELSWEELKEKGFHRYTGVGGGYMNIGNATDIKPDETLTANTWHTEEKMPWPTLTRRMQFLIDHEFYVELGEQLPVHKDPPPIGGDYPLAMTSGHERWSIHAAWREELNLLRLQRGGPVVYLSAQDAAARDIQDGDEVRVFNDMDSFRLQAKVSAAIGPGTVIVYHAWEPFQFKDHKSQQAITPNPLNPIQMAGGYFHLQPRLAYGTPGSSDRGTRVDVERVSRDRLPPSTI